MFPIREFKKILYYHRTFEEYKRLKNDVNFLKARMVGLEEVVRENTQLEKLLEFKRKLIYSSVAANVVGRDPSFWNSSMIIDKGAKDGIKEGLSVVNSLGVVGKVVEVAEDSSKVILLTDPQFSVAALLQRTRETGLISGTLQGICRLRFVDENANIVVGDKVITSSLSSNFPEHLIIGEVVEIIEEPNSSSVQFLVQPSVSLSQIEKVLVVIKE